MPFSIVFSYTLQLLDKHFFIGGVGWVCAEVVSGKLEESLAGYQSVCVGHEYGEKNASLIVCLCTKDAETVAEPSIVRIEVWKSGLGTDDAGQLTVGDQTMMLLLLSSYPPVPCKLLKHWKTLISYLAYKISLCGHFGLRLSMALTAAS